MRILTYFVLGFGTACGLCAYLLTEEVFLPVMGMTLSLALLVRLAAGSSKTLRQAALVFLGCTLGIFWYGRFHDHTLRAAVELDGQTRVVTIRTTDYSYETAYGIGADGVMELDGRSCRVRAYLDAGEPLEPGTELTGPFRFRATTPVGGQEATYHRGEGIFLLAYQTDETEVFSGVPDWRVFPAILRRRITAILESCFPADACPFAKALLLGDTTDLTYEVDTGLKISGIRHVVAVSGLHVSIMFGLISMVALKNRWLTALLGFPALLLFAAVAGFSPSVTRACVMTGLMLLAMLAGKEYDGPTALAFAVLVMLLINPLVITSVSFQLSVASVAGIFLFGADIRKWLLSKFREGRNFLIKWFVSSISVSLSAMTLTVPLCAWYFGTVSLIGVVTNLLTLWIISLIFYGLMGVCLLSLIWEAGAAVLASAVSIPIRLVLWLADVLARVPMAAVYTCSGYITAWLVFVYLLLLVFLGMRNKKPLLLFCCAVWGLCLALLASWTEPMLDDVRFTVLDVGQGQCLLLQTEGKTIMIDCGGDSDTEAADIAAETLLSQGIAHLDALILTHTDRDHGGAAANLLSRIDTDLLILPPERTGIANATKGEVVYAENDLLLTIGNTEIKIFVPTFEGNRNEKSLCLLLDAKKCVILITGDRSGVGERALLRSSHIPDVDILVAGHHGSKSATCEELLRVCRPETVCISAGRDNSYGHPAPELLKRLSAFGCAVFRTDIHGTITIRR